MDDLENILFLYFTAKTRAVLWVRVLFAGSSITVVSVSDRHAFITASMNRDAPSVPRRKLAMETAIASSQFHLKI